MVLAGEYYSMYAAVTLQYPPEATVKGFGRDFFIGEKPGKIIFSAATNKELPFENYSLLNVLDFSKEKIAMDNFCAVERQEAMDYESRYGDIIFSGNDTSVKNQYFKVLRPALGRKKLRYIKDHPLSYFSFYSFRTDVAKPSIATPDSLLLIFNSFPDSFKYSDEGNYLNAFLHGQKSRQKGSAIMFEARDIYKRKVSLAQFKGSKYILLHFWATWCTPCMRELPAIKEINEQFRFKDLQIISIAVRSNEADYKKTINKYGMDWIHIYDDVDLLNKYGNLPTPRICLIDKSGKMVYDSIGLNENDDQLSQLKQALKEAMQ